MWRRCRPLLPATAAVSSPPCASHTQPCGMQQRGRGSCPSVPAEKQVAGLSPQCEPLVNWLTAGRRAGLGRGGHQAGCVCCLLCHRAGGVRHRSLHMRDRSEKAHVVCMCVWCACACVCPCVCVYVRVNVCVSV